MTMRRSIVPFLAAGLVACADHGPRRPLVVSIEASARQFTRGESIDLRVVAHNVSQAPQTLQQYCFEPFAIFKPTGVAVPRPGLYCLAVALPYAIVAPGDSVVFNTRWDGSVSDGAGNTITAPQGDYFLAGRVLAPDEITGQPVPVRFNY